VFVLPYQVYVLVPCSTDGPVFSLPDVWTVLVLCSVDGPVRHLVWTLGFFSQVDLPYPTDGPVRHLVWTLSRLGNTSIQYSNHPCTSPIVHRITRTAQYYGLEVISWSVFYHVFTGVLLEFVPSYWLNLLLQQSVFS
jgi:hypothetical protein